MTTTDNGEYRDAGGFIAEVIRSSRRKTADIRVEQGVVSVIVPQELSDERIDRLLADKRSWIKEKMLVHREARPASARRFVSGEAIPYLGRNYRLKVIDGPFKAPKLDKGQLVVSVPGGADAPEMVRNAIIRWYRRRAVEKLPAKVGRLAPSVGVSPGKVEIKAFRSRWGSCTPKGDVAFNWRIMMAPNRVVDYIVVHELCHLIRHDHSAAYWREVARVMPDYDQWRSWLRYASHELEI
ncbi:SprT family zinc-dependent metalloprotease [Halospina sp. K52047b]|uniref:M48 family metallopeptidase n=1 Tax=Halospina sp. K52047b TaxID=2614160 RepID=UPI00124ABDDF|nr:SprT family zinc-dependent metalloprotease [Halospina sp. K52047b]KAA8984360.1 M48 family metallopeptidase [Halospina sp. K52047b]